MTNGRVDSGAWKTRTQRDLIRLASWTGAWIVTMALATFGPQWVWDAPGLTLLAILLNLAIGLGMIRANIRHLNMLDEMMRRIQLEAMALALGVGIVFGLSYSLLDTTGLIAADAEIAFLVMLIGVTYLVGTAVGYRRYR
jgi:hypothetical protein